MSSPRAELDLRRQIRDAQQSGNARAELEARRQLRAQFPSPGQLVSTDISVPRETLGTEAGFREQFGIQPSGLGPADIATPQPGGLRAATTAALGGPAEALAGVAGLASLPFGAETAAQNVEAVRGALSVPQTDESGRVLGRLGELVPPIAERVGRGFLDVAEDIGRANPAAGALFRTLPAAAAEVVGLGGGRRLLAASKQAGRKTRQRALREAAPTPDELQAAVRAQYDEVKAIGGQVSPGGLEKLTSNIEGLFNRTLLLSPGNAPRAIENLGTVRNFRGLRGVTPTELDDLRQSLRAGKQQAVPRSRDAELLSQMIDEVDEFLDEAGPGDIIATAGQRKKIQQHFRLGRQLHGQKKRAELIQDAFDNAELNENFEAGIKSEFKKLISTPKRRRVFNPDELEAMKLVVEGDTSVNLFRLLGRFGFRNNQVFIPSAGAAIGGALFGIDGATAVAGIGHVSKSFAERLRTRAANTADAVIRAGRDADKVVAAYLRTTKNPSARELSQLLMQPRVDLDRGLFRTALAQRAAQMARRNRAALAGVLAAGSITQPQSPTGQ